MANNGECELLSQANQRAHEKGLMKDGQSLYCGFAAICNGLHCILAESLPLQAPAPNGTHPPTPMVRFAERLRKTTTMHVPAAQPRA